MLCRLLNALSPTKPIDAMRADDPSLANKPDPDRYLRTHNHAAFVRGAKTFGLDDDDMFGLDDLGGLRGDPSKVLRCLTALKWRTDASLNQNKNSGNPFAATTAKTFASSGNPFGEPPAPHAAALARLAEDTRGRYHLEMGSHRRHLRQRRAGGARGRESTVG